MPAPFRNACQSWSCSTASPIFRRAAQSPPTSGSSDWAGDLDKLAQRKIHRYPTVADGAERIVGRNPRLTREQAMHLATHGMKRNDDGSFSWKYDPYLRARAPYRLSLEDNIGLWSRIACPTLLVAASESFLPDPEKAGVMSHFKHAELAKIAGAGHWLQHDRPDEVLGLIQRFLATTRS